MAKNKGGRPPKYKTEYNKQAEIACAEFGADDKQLGKFIGVCKATITIWKKEYPEFLASLKKGKDVFDTTHVEKSLLKRALGYTYIEKHTEAIVDKDGKITKLQKVKNITREVPPDTTAQIFWLKNRNHERWYDRKFKEEGGSDNNADIEPYEEFKKKHVKGDG